MEHVNRAGEVLLAGLDVRGRTQTSELAKPGSLPQNAKCLVPCRPVLHAELNGDLTPLGKALAPRAGPSEARPELYEAFL